MSGDPKIGGYARITPEGWAVAKARTGALSAIPMR